jgi:hypothetical protein
MRDHLCGTVWLRDGMNVPLIVVVSLAFPLLWLSAFTDRRSYDHAIKLREMITEILQSIAEWENGKLGVTKILAFKGYGPNLENKLKLIRGYLLIRFLAKLPRKSNIHAACVIFPEFYECVWSCPPGFRQQADFLARRIKRLLK